MSHTLICKECKKPVVRDNYYPFITCFSCKVKKKKISNRIDLDKLKEKRKLKNLQQ